MVNFVPRLLGGVMELLALWKIWVLVNLPLLQQNTWGGLLIKKKGVYLAYSLGGLYYWLILLIFSHGCFLFYFMGCRPYCITSLLAHSVWASATGSPRWHMCPLLSVFLSAFWKSGKLWATQTPLVLGLESTLPQRNYDFFISVWFRVPKSGSRIAS